MSNHNQRLVCLAGSILIAACGSTPATDAGSDTGTATDEGTRTDAGAVDVPTNADVLNPGVLNGCAAADFSDRSAADGGVREVHFHSPRYAPRCMTIAVGQSVLFMGDYPTYPLAPGNAPSRTGDPASATPNPIPAQSTGDFVVVRFPTAGRYGFYCPGQEASAGMYGVIDVR